RPPHRLVAQDWMLGLGRRALAVDLGPRIGGVDLDVLDVATGGYLDAPFAALLEALELLVLHLHVPGEVVFARLDHGARRAHRVAAALHLDLVEEGPVRDVIVRVDLTADDIARLEIDKLEGARSHGLEVCRRLARLVALEGLEEVLWNDLAARRATEWRRPERLRRFEDDLHGTAVTLVHPPHVPVRSDGGGGGARVHHVFPC